MSGFDIVSAHKISVHIIQHLIRVDITVIVWCRNRIRVIIIQTWDERTYYKRIGFKGLVYRRWLADSSRNRFEIVSSKRVRKVIAVVSDNIKWVRSINHI